MITHQLPHGMGKIYLITKFKDSKFELTTKADLTIEEAKTLAAKLRVAIETAEEWTSAREGKQGTTN